MLIDSIPTQIWSSLIGIFGAVVGYGFSEYRNKLIPFFEITSIDDVGKRDDPELLDRAIAERLAGNFYIGEMTIKPGPQIPTTNGEITYRYRNSHRLQQFWPEVKRAVEQLITKSSDDEYLRVLPSLFDLTWFDRFLLQAIEKTSRLQMRGEP